MGDRNLLPLNLQIYSKGCSINGIDSWFSNLVMNNAQFAIHDNPWVIFHCKIIQKILSNHLCLYFWGLAVHPPYGGVNYLENQLINSIE